MAHTTKDIDVIAVNPGSLLNTNMVKEAFGSHQASADKGADILYNLATDSVYDETKGKYFDNDKGDFGTAHKNAYDAGRINELIEATQVILKNENKADSCYASRNMKT